MALRVTPPTAKKEGAEEDEAEEGRLYSWPLRSKLGLTLLDRTNADGTHSGEERRERNGNVKVLKDQCDSRRKDELITSRGIQIHI